MTGGDWDHTLWGGELPDRNWIDAATPETPVWMPRLDGHMALANTAAMRAAGIDEEVADVPGGEIVRDAAGRPTGIFKDNAMQLIDRVCPLPGLAQRLASSPNRSVRRERPLRWSMAGIEARTERSRRSGSSELNRRRAGCWIGTVANGSRQALGGTLAEPVLGAGCTGLRLYFLYSVDILRPAG